MRTTHLTRAMAPFALCFATCCGTHAQAAAPDADGWITLFNGQNLEGWYPYLLTSGKNDVNGVFQVDQKMVHILGTDKPLSRRDTYGYLATNEEYANIRIHVEYKWGTRRFPSGSERKRNSGLIYLFHGTDQVFPQSVECQIQESDVGDIWLTDGISAESWVADLGSSLYSDDNSQPGFKRLFGGPGIPNARIIKAGDFENRDGWNTVEVVLEGNTATNIVNGRIVSRALDIRQPDPQNPKQMLVLSKGRILLEAESAEIWFRNIRIKPLDPDQSAPGAAH